METLPGYMRDVKPRHLEFRCRLTLLASLAAGQFGPELAKFSHVEHVKEYANGREWYVLYTRIPYSFHTNINLTFLSGGTLSFFGDAERFESLLKMPRRTFDYICSLVKESSVQDTNSYTFLDGKLLRLEDRGAIALIMLNSGEPPATIGSSIGVHESTVSLVTESFVNATYVRARHHSCWSSTGEIDKIKSKFTEIHGLPNCCGVVHTTRIPFGPQNRDRGKNGDVLMQVIVDSDMRFIDIELRWSGTKNQLTILHHSHFFEECKKGARLNGNKLKVSLDVSEEVGEYIIGDARYPLLPWLFTPYQQLENDLSNSKVKFNKRHSEAIAVAPKAMARLKDTWKWLHGGACCPGNQGVRWLAIRVCCMLHNIVIDMEEGAGMPSNQEAKRSKQVRRLADEDAVRARDVLSQHLLTSRSSESRVDQMDEEQQEAVSSSSGDKEQQEENTLPAAEWKGSRTVL